MTGVNEDQLAALVLAGALLVFTAMGGLFYVAHDNGVAALFFIAAVVAAAMLFWLAYRIRRHRPRA